METALKERFIRLWRKYFGPADLPIVFFYTDEKPAAETPPGRCIIQGIYRVLEGRDAVFDAETARCAGGRRYAGFTSEVMPDFEYFLSCGIPGKLEGERYKKSPELVREFMRLGPELKAPAKYLVFKRWDKVGEEIPEAVVFFARADVLSGLFTLANFDRPDMDGVYSPFGAGCSTAILYPRLERNAALPRAVLGMFDVSARPFVGEDRLSFSVPFNRFLTMIGNMEESFLVTDSWKAVLRRIQKTELENMKC
ncbi:MAG TPA: DUF169 domain-containing protein [Syntrophales bacterium]|nr:DUF169 domain-containing protein [Syntrophales bacterium]